MITKGSRVRHQDEQIDATKGVMLVFEIKGNYAICAYGDYARYGEGMETYLISDLILA